MLQKVLGNLLIALALVLGLLGVPNANASTQTFVDVPPGTQFHDEIEWLAASKVTTGWEVAPDVREYRPLSPINRDAMAAFLYRLAGSPEFVPTTQTFVDVTPATTFYAEIEWLAANEISTGWAVGGAHEFRPVQPINRDAMAAFLYRFANKPAYQEPDRSFFGDVSPGSTYYAEMSWLASKGISTGWSDASGCPTFRPVQPINRDAMAAFLYRYVNGGTDPLTEQCGAPHPQPEPEPEPDLGVVAANQLANGFAVPSAAQSRNSLAGLSVQAPGSMAGYARTEFPHWRDADTWGWPPVPVSTCDVRQAALYREGKDVTYTSACDILSGTWLDAYTTVTLYDKSDVDVDHIVPLAEAWRTGASAWTSTQRTAFANHPLEVIAVDDGANASKGDKTPDLWKPPNRAAHCLYAKRWIAIKAAWQLTVNSSEKAALDSMLNTCEA